MADMKKVQAQQYQFALGCHIASIGSHQEPLQRQIFSGCTSAAILRDSQWLQSELTWQTCSTQEEHS